MSELTEHAAEASGEQSPSPSPRWPHIALAAILIVSALGLYWVWFVWESPMGPSVPNLVTYSLSALLFVLILIWMGRYAPFSRKARWIGVALLLLPVLAYGLTVESIELTGDMKFVIRHHWDDPPPRAGEAPPLAANVRTLPVETDMPLYRGWDSKGIVQGPPLSQDWPTAQPLWRHGCGEGYSQPAVLGDFLVTLEQLGQEEAVVCYDTATGGERWAHRYSARFDEAMGGPGPRSTPTIDGEQVFAVGAQGDLHCLSLLDGELHWHVNLLKRHQVPNTDWGITSSPLVTDDLVIVNPGAPQGDGLAAYNRTTGEVVWETAGLQATKGTSSSRNRPGYATPFLAEIHGHETLVMFDGTGLRGYEPATGKLLWDYAHENGAGVNVAQPIVFDDGRIFISCSYDVGCAMVQVSLDEAQETWSARRVWKNKNLRCKFTNPVLHDGLIYGLDEGILVCLDPENGKRRWKRGRYGHGQILLTNDQFVIFTEDGRLVLVDPSPEELIEVTSLQVLTDAKNWNPPALVDGRIYVRNHREMAAYDLRAAQD